jgi:uncharacterized protein YqfB (UPF0267 family)
VLTGRKTQTLRARIPRGVDVGVVLDAGCRYDRPPFARLRVVGVDLVDVAALDEQDVEREGLERLDDLRAAVGELYADAGSLVRVRFELVSPSRRRASARSSGSPQ